MKYWMSIILLVLVGATGGMVIFIPFHSSPDTEAAASVSGHVLVNLKMAQLLVHLFQLLQRVTTCNKRLSALPLDESIKLSTWMKVRLVRWIVLPPKVLTNPLKTMVSPGTYAVLSTQAFRWICAFFTSFSLGFLNDKNILMLVIIVQI